MCYCVFALLLTLAMKRIEDDMLHFLEWLADNHEDALRLAIYQAAIHRVKALLGSTSQEGCACHHYNPGSPRSQG